MVPSMFDIIGPVMVGPSSSHTAGALKIALIARIICPNKDFKKITFTLFGSFSETYRGHGTDKALVAGLLGISMDDLRVRDSLDIAKKKGIDVEFIEDRSINNYHPNTVNINIECTDGYKFRVLGESIGGGAIRIRMINDIRVRINGEHNALILYLKNDPGMLARITAIIASFDVGVEAMQLYTNTDEDTSYIVIESEESINLDLTSTLAKLPQVVTAIRFNLESIKNIDI